MADKAVFQIAPFPASSGAVLGVVCSWCGYTLISWHRHDIRTCRCTDPETRISVDGGRHYLKIMAGSKASYSEVEVKDLAMERQGSETVHAVVPPKPDGEMPKGPRTIPPKAYADPEIKKGNAKRRRRR